MKILRVAALTASLSLLASCASIGYGNEEFGCKGIPAGKECSTTEEVYQATDGDMSESPWKKAGKLRQGKNSKTSPTVVVKRTKIVLPSHSDPIPLRTPAQVMRIWIAPWEDKDGDLHMASLVYSEIEHRRWVVGSKVGDAGLGRGVWLRK
jgi:conjugal transfer pilus assembly protein TraV